MNQNVDKMVHDSDVRTMNEKQRETDFLHKGLKDRQKEDKEMLGQIYQNQIDQAKKLKNNQYQMERELERRQIEKLKGIDPNEYNKLKKQAYSNELKQEIDQRNKFKQYEYDMKQQSVREAKQLMDEYAQKEIENELNFKNKFTKFDKNMEQRAREYNNYVMKPNIDKQCKLDMIEDKNVDEYNQRRAQDEMGREAWRKAQMLQTSTEQRNQMNEQHKMKKLNGEFKNIEVQRTSERVSEVNTFDNMLREDKKKRQDMYREMLSSQIQYNKGLKAMGNMTQVEKKLNKQDLKAYKNFGVIPNQKTNKPKKKISYEEEQRRLDAYGYGRYMRKVPTVGPIENYNANMSTMNQRSNSFAPMNRSFTRNSNGDGLGQHSTVQRDISAAPQSRRHQHSSRGNPSQRSLRNAGVISMAKEGRPAGSPSNVYQYRNPVL